MSIFLLAELARHLPKYGEVGNYSIYFSQTPKASHYYYEKGGETQRLHLNCGIASNLRGNQNSEVLDYEEFPEDADARPPGAGMPFGGCKNYAKCFRHESFREMTQCFRQR